MTNSPIAITETQTSEVDRDDLPLIRQDGPAAPSEALTLEVHEGFLLGLEGKSDVTLHWPFNAKECAEARKQMKPADGRPGFPTIDEKVTLKIEKINGVKLVRDCRACICSCFDGNYLSGTFRHDSFETAFSGKFPLLAHAKKKDFLIDNHEHAERLFQLFWPDKPNETPSQGTAAPLRRGSFHPQGLVILAGATKSGKSEIARALALRVILELRQRIAESKVGSDPEVRLPHLVTFEDPIEAWELYDESGKTKLLDAHWNNPARWLMHGISFTPRKRGKDVVDLLQALRDARRQTPACVYVGEVRAKEEWEEILDFAGSGHLIIVTTHAGSLVEAMLRVMDSIEATTPQARRTFANNLRGCVHLRMTQCGKKSLVLPAVWTQTPQAINSLVAEGPSSITPNGKFVLGRHHYLTVEVGQAFRKSEKRNTWSPKTLEPRRAVSQCAIKLDLEEVVGR